jgi:hypothetical protein
MGPLKTVAVIIATVVLLTILAIMLASTAFMGMLIQYELGCHAMKVVTTLAKVSDIYHRLKTGDLLLFASCMSSMPHSIIWKQPYDHIGMIVRGEGDSVYHSETSPENAFMRTPDGTVCRLPAGASMTPLLTRLKHYNGFTYLMRLSRALDPARERAARALTEYLTHVGFKYPTLAQFLLGLALGRKARDARHCAQHVAHIIDEIKLTPLDQEGGLSDLDFVKVGLALGELPGRPLPDGYYYEPPIRLVYDIGALDFKDTAAPAPEDLDFLSTKEFSAPSLEDSNAPAVKASSALAFKDTDPV